MTNYILIVNITKKYSFFFLYSHFKEFEIAYSKFFIGGDVSQIFSTCDVNKDGFIDYVDWSDGLALEDLRKF